MRSKFQIPEWKLPSGSLPDYHHCPRDSFITAQGQSSPVPHTIFFSHWKLNEYRNKSSFSVLGVWVLEPNPRALSEPSSKRLGRKVETKKAELLNKWVERLAALGLSIIWQKPVRSKLGAGESDTYLAGGVKIKNSVRRGGAGAGQDWASLGGSCSSCVCQRKGSFARQPERGFQHQCQNLQHHALLHRHRGHRQPVVRRNRWLHLP